MNVKYISIIYYLKNKLKKHMLTYIKTITADNKGPSTYKGTNTYILGEKELIVIDPGPNSKKHLSNVIDYIDGRKVKCIIATHHHGDHIGIMDELAASQNAPIYVGKMQRSKMQDALKISKDRLVVFDGPIVSSEFEIDSIYTPGHASDHYCYRIPGIALFSGDHIMGWSTTMIRLPDGNMGKYIESLIKIRDICHEKLLPGHGNTIIDGRKRCITLLEHRNKRTGEILKLLESNDMEASQITAIIYSKLSPNLRNYALFTVESSLAELQEAGIIKKVTSQKINKYSINST